MNCLTQNWSAEYWVSLGAPRDKLVIGVPTYGRCFTLANPSTASGIGAPASGPCSAGSYTLEAGFLAYYEVNNVRVLASKIMKEIVTA